MKTLRLLLAPALLVLPVLATADIYKSIGPDGTVVYSDQPSPGAEKIRVQQPSTYTPPPLPKFQPTQRASDQAAPAYERLSVVSPKPEETIRDNEGTVIATFAVKPALQTDQGHRLVVLLDGNRQKPISVTRIQFNNVDRGAHTIQAMVIDGNGKTLIESDPVTFYLHRQSIHFPARQGG